MKNALSKIKCFFARLFKKIKQAITAPDRKQKEGYFALLRTFVAVVIALSISCVILLLASDKPGVAISTLLTGPIKDSFWRAEIFRNSVPLIFAGVAACVMLKAGQFNMIGEGSFYIGGLTAAVVAIALPSMPFFAVLIACAAAMAVTALIGSVPAVLKAKLGVSEFVLSLMLNFIMLWAGMYFLQNFFKDENYGDVATNLIPFENRFSGLINGTYLTTNIILALAAAVLIGLFIYKTKWGYTIRVTGNNAGFAKYSGLNQTGAIIYSQIIGSSVAGLGGAAEILASVDGRFSWKALPGYGFDGFIVAILSGNNPFLVPFAALFLSYLRTGAVIMAANTDVASEIISIIQAIIIIVVAGTAFMSKYKHIFLTGNKNKKSKEAQL